MQQRRLPRSGRAHERDEVAGRYLEACILEDVDLLVPAAKGLADVVEWRRSVPYDEMPEIFARASCFVLASLATKWWEEQFGMVLAEAAAAGLPIIAAESGAIPEVLRGSGTLVPAGDWRALADALAVELSTPPRRHRPSELAEVYSVEAAAARYAAAYARVLSSR